MIETLGWIAAAIFAGITFLGGPFYKTGPQARPGETLQIAEHYTLGIVEFDDQGWYRDRSDAERVLRKVTEEAQANGATIVVFVHGWHHGSAADDSNLQSFKVALDGLHEELQQKIYREAREGLAPGARNRVVGLYVGWRGRSMPGRLTFLTFWDRKPAAIRVGHGDVPELFARLNAIYRRFNGSAEYPGHFTGLVTIGHSFGAQVVYGALSDQIKAGLATDLEDAASHGDVLPIIRGFGDLTVLINPAFEASIYNTIDVLTRGKVYSPYQSPLMLTVSSEADFPNRRLFPIGRGISVLNEPRGSADQYSQKVHTLGHHVPHLTHCMFVRDGDAPAECRELKGPPDPRPAGVLSPDPILLEAGDLTVLKKSKKAGEALFGTLGAVWTAEDFDKPQQMALAGDLCLNGVCLQRLEPLVDVNHPFLVAKASRQLIDGHSDVFKPVMVKFLIEYAAGVELKRAAVLRTVLQRSQTR